MQVRQGVRLLEGDPPVCCNPKHHPLLHAMRARHPQHSRPVWRAAHRGSLQSRGVERLKAMHEHVDVVVVGAGIIGLSVALELLEQSRDISVAVTDKVRCIHTFLPAFAAADSPALQSCTHIERAHRQSSVLRLLVVTASAVHSIQ